MNYSDILIQFLIFTSPVILGAAWLLLKLIFYSVGFIYYKNNGGKLNYKAYIKRANINN